MPLRPDQVKAAIAASEGNPKFTRIRDGASLYLMTRNGRGYWQFNYREGKSLRSKMLGTAADLSPNQARQKREAFKVERRSGSVSEAASGHRLVERAAEAAGPLFSVLVAEFLDGYEHDGDHVPGKAEGWRGTSEADTYRRNLVERGKLASMYVVKIAPQDIAAHLRLFEGKPKTAERVRSHIQNVMAFAIAREFRPKDSDNPASTEGPLKYLPWPKVDQSNNVVVPHPAMPSQDVPAFFRDLQAIDTPAARALSFIVLTAVRAQEAVGAKWGEIDVEQMVWTLPGSRMKGKGRGREHAVPLTSQMLAIIGRPGASDDHIFPGDADGHVGEKSPIRTLRPLYPRSAGPAAKADVHGFRSTFSDYVVDHTDIADREALVDLALGHLKHRDKTQRAYLRSTRLEQRRAVMQRWSEFVTAKAAAPG
jgi:integrase